MYSDKEDLSRWNQIDSNYFFFLSPENTKMPLLLLLSQKERSTWKYEIVLARWWNSNFKYLFTFAGGREQWAAETQLGWLSSMGVSPNLTPKSGLKPIPVWDQLPQVLFQHWVLPLWHKTRPFWPSSTSPGQGTSRLGRVRLPRGEARRGRQVTAGTLQVCIRLQGAALQRGGGLAHLLHGRDTFISPPKHPSGYAGATACRGTSTSG